LQTLNSRTVCVGIAVERIKRHAFSDSAFALEVLFSQIKFTRADVEVLASRNEGAAFEKRRNLLQRCIC